MSVLGHDAARRYTVEEMPDYEGKLELVDGRLEVSPPAQRGHWLVASQVVDILKRYVPEAYRVGAEVGVQFGPHSYRQPDVGVVSVDAEQPGKWFSPQEVMLAVEVVSESTLTADRITKPAQYARAGIAAFWRIETRPELELAAYVLEPGDDVYTEVGAWRAGQTVTVERPFPVSFELDALQS